MGVFSAETSGAKLETAALVFAGLGAAQSFSLGKMALDHALCTNKNQVEPMDN